MSGNWISNNYNPCGGGGPWCAYFSFATATNWPTCTMPLSDFNAFTYGSTLAYSTTYYFELKVAGGGNLEGLLFDSSWHQLWSFEWNTGASGFPLAENWGLCGWYDFTNYEELVPPLNPVQDFPAWNLHTNISWQLEPCPPRDSCPAPTFSTFASQNEPGFTTPPSDFPGQMVVSQVNLQHWNMNIDNLPFAAWVGTWFGNGLVSVTISHSVRNVITEWINPLADPSGGYDVYLQYNYCPIPCSDVTFSSSYAIVQSDSQFYNPDAYMTVTIPAYQLSAGNTYWMSMYAYDPGAGSYMSQWNIVVT